VPGELLAHARDVEGKHLMEERLLAEARLHRRERVLEAATQVSVPRHRIMDGIAQEHEEVAGAVDRTHYGGALLQHRAARGHEHVDRQRPQPFQALDPRADVRVARVRRASVLDELARECDARLWRETDGVARRVAASEAMQLEDARPEAQLDAIVEDEIRPRQPGYLIGTGKQLRATLDLRLELAPPARRDPVGRRAARDDNGAAECRRPHHARRVIVREHHVTHRRVAHASQIGEHDAGQGGRRARVDDENAIVRRCEPAVGFDAAQVAVDAGRQLDDLRGVARSVRRRNGGPRHRGTSLFRRPRAQHALARRRDACGQHVDIADLV
jgi:hypothetical protein